MKRSTAPRLDEPVRLVRKPDRRQKNSLPPGRPDRRAPQHEQVARRAFELYCEQGRHHGRDLDHWLQAEREVAAPPNLG